MYVSDVRIEADHGRPVPARSDREHGVEGRRGVLEAALGEQGQRPELVQGRVVGQRAKGLVREAQGRRVVARLEGLASLVEERDRRIGHRLAGRGGQRADRLRVVEDDRLLHDHRCCTSRVIGVVIGRVAPVVEAGPVAHSPPFRPSPCRRGPSRHSRQAPRPPSPGPNPGPTLAPSRIPARSRQNPGRQSPTARSHRFRQ